MKVILDSTAIIHQYKSYLLEALEELRKENVDLSYLAKRD